MHNDVWKNACVTLRTMLSTELFNRWFVPIHPMELQGGTLVLAVPNEFSRIWLQDNFLPLVRETVSQAAKMPTQVKFIVVAHALNRVAVSHTPSRPTVECVPVVSPASAKLNPRYTFDAFVVGPNNHHAHAASLLVAQAPGTAYNPLFLYGGVGLGKTHLMQAIGQYAANHGKARRVCYTTTEEFTNNFIQALGDNSLAKFRKKYRQADVLLIDDIHFLASKERMQEEFFHTFNSLFDSHKQIVLSCDRPAAEVANLEHRLVSRFEWGLAVDLQPPDLETRIAILNKKAATLSVKIPEELVLFLAGKIKSNIRRLEGALTRVASFFSLSDQEISLEIVQSVLKDVLHEEAKRTLSIETIQKKVACHFDIRMADMTSHRRPRNIALPRQIAMYLCRELTDQSLTQIGETFGGRDHGTVLYAYRQISSAVEKEPKLRLSVSFLRESLVCEHLV